MKKIIAMFVALVMVFSIAVTAYAATNDIEVMCPKCGKPGTSRRVWTEYNYYYTTVWHEFECGTKSIPGCGNIWTTSIIIINITREMREVTTG